MITINKCIVCSSTNLIPQFSKPSAHGDSFSLVKCAACGMKFLSQAPDESEIRKYYGKEYFTKRTERGYDDYFSTNTKNEIERVFKLNLSDLDFYNYENKLRNPKYSLDIGCAAGYFVGYLKERGWQSSGIDVSKNCVDFARKSGLDVREGDYLKEEFQNKFNLITLWSTLEHLHHPDVVLQKAYNDMVPGGMLYISTCRADGFNFMRLFGSKWRFYNFPEHIYYFPYKNIKRLLADSGFDVTNYKTYGSNIGKSKSIIRKGADKLAKKLSLGDMMLIAAEKKRKGYC